LAALTRRLDEMLLNNPQRSQKLQRNYDDIGVPSFILPGAPLKLARSAQCAASQKTLLGSAWEATAGFFRR
jgi:hypothetical protein